MKQFQNYCESKQPIEQLQSSLQPIGILTTFEDTNQGGNQDTNSVSSVSSVSSGDDMYLSFSNNGNALTEKSLKRRKTRKSMDIPQHLFGIQTTFKRASSLPASSTTTELKTIFAPKGIYKTPHGYRVQLNVDNGTNYLKKMNSNISNFHFSTVRKTESPDFHSSSPLIGVSRSKFSRNSRCLQESMWLYEVAILISDCPQTTLDMICRGNSESMVSMQWVKTVKEYLNELDKYLNLLFEYLVISKKEYEYATEIFNCMVVNVDSNVLISTIIEEKEKQRINVNMKTNPLSYSISGMRTSRLNTSTKRKVNRICTISEPVGDSNSNENKEDVDITDNCSSSVSVSDGALHTHICKKLKTELTSESVSTHSTCEKPTVVEIPFSNALIARTADTVNLANVTLNTTTPVIAPFTHTNAFDLLCNTAELLE